MQDEENLKFITCCLNVAVNVEILGKSMLKSDFVLWASKAFMGLLSCFEGSR